MDALLVSAGTALAVTVGVTFAVWLACRRWQLVDTPNERSAHVVPTPTLGGVGIVAGIVAALWSTPAAGDLRWPLTLCLLLLSVAVVDDTGRPFSVGRKLLLQVAAAWLWVALAPTPALQLTFDIVVPAGGPAGFVTCLLLLGLMNVCNFMDGIDGFTGTQLLAMCAGLACMPVGAIVPGALPVIVGAACLGFLLLNRPPARIFMGDVGSMSLGFVLGVIILGIAAAGIPLCLAALPVTLYWVDTSTTIISRLLRGDNVLQAHNQHLYQRLVQAGWSHGQVDGAAFLLTSAFAAAAVLAASDQRAGSLAFGVPACLVLIAAVYWKERRWSRQALPGSGGGAH